MATILSDRMLELMDKRDRKTLGKAGRTMAEIKVTNEAKSERQLQNQMAALCEQRNLFYWRSRMDKRTTVQKGMPDFFIFARSGRYLAVEAKVPDGILSQDQATMFCRFLNMTGHMVHVVRSLQEFKELLDEEL